MDDVAQRKIREQTVMMSTTTGYRNRWTGALLALLVLAGLTSAAGAMEQTKGKDGAGAIPRVSYDKQIRPIFQAHVRAAINPPRQEADM